MGSLAWVRPEGAPIARLVAPWTVARASDAELVVAVPVDEAVAIGAFQRSTDAGSSGLPVFRRASGGAALRLGPGTVFVQLALARVDALVPCAPDQILNRYVRPLLAAITKLTGRPARYFGRDWISIGWSPVAAVGFGHDTETGAAVFEAVVSATSAVFVDRARASFRGKEPAILEADPRRVADAIADAYGAIGDPTLELSFDPRDAIAPLDPDERWQAVRDEAIGFVAAGRDARGVMRVGGELMASRDAIARLEAAIASEDVDVGVAVDETLGAPEVVTFGVRSLASIRDAILAARQA
jgi:hypothetical protein